MKFIFKSLKILLAFIFITLLFAVICLFIIPLENVTQKTLLSFLKQMGFPEAHATVSSFGLNGTIINSFDLGDKDRFNIAKAKATYDFQGIRKKEIEKLELSGITLKIQNSKDGISLGNLDKVISALDKNKQDTSSRNITIRKIVIDNSFISFDGSAMTITLPFSAELIQENELYYGHLDVKSMSVEFAELFLSSLGNISMSGLFNANIPVTLQDGKLLIHNGTITSNKEGFIKLQPHAESALKNPTDSNLALLAKALENYQYKILKFGINSAEDGRINTSIAINGSNPQLYDGREINLNVNITADIMGIVTDIINFEKLNYRPTEQGATK